MAWYAQIAPGTCSGFSASSAARNFEPGEGVLTRGMRSAEKRRNAGALFLELFQRGIHLFAGEGVDLQTRDAGVFAAVGGDRNTIHHVLWNAVAAVGSHTHRDPFAAAAQYPV